MNPMMTCGHSANAIEHTKDENGKEISLPCCAICACSTVNDKPPSLEGRTATCSYGGNPVPSSSNLAFFRHRPERETDEYYCGCFGWD